MAILDPVDPEPLVTERDKTRTQAGDPVAGEGVSFEEGAMSALSALAFPSPNPSAEQVESMGLPENTQAGSGLLAHVETGGSSIIGRALGRLRSVLGSGKSPKEMAEAVTDAYTGANKKEVFQRLLKTGAADDAEEAGEMAGRIATDAERANAQIVSKQKLAEERGAPSENVFGSMVKSTSENPGPVALVRKDAPTPSSTMAHEMSHAAMMGPEARIFGNPLKTTGVQKTLDRAFPGRAGKTDKVFSNNEIQARFNQLRFEIDSDNPWRRFDADEVGTAIANLSEQGNTDIIRMANAAKGENAQETSETLTNLLNKMFTAGGAATVASTQTSDQEGGAGD